MPAADPPQRRKTRLPADVAGAFLKLGCVSFGGPVAHLGYLREEFVAKRRWLDDAEYADLVALCQFLPGPASSQLVFALGMRRAGFAGAMLASLFFTLPSAILMILFAYGVAGPATPAGAGWLHGLKVAAVAVVAQAVVGMWKTLCPDTPRRGIAVTAAGVVLAFPGALAQVVVIAAAGLIGRTMRRHEEVATPAPPVPAREHRWAAGALAVFAGLLLVLPALAANGGRDAAMFAGFYRAGALVFGGGHVVLPMLRAEVVPPGWISDDAFLAGYGAAQAVPGPLFTLAGYLGTLCRGGPHAWLGGLLGLTAIFLPAWLLIGGALPFWKSLKERPAIRASMRGANAAVAGILLAALITPVGTAGLRGGTDVVSAALAFLLLERFGAPAWLVVFLAAATGAALG